LFFLNEALPSHCQNIEIKEFSILISLARIVAQKRGSKKGGGAGAGSEAVPNFCEMATKCAKCLLSWPELVTISLASAFDKFP